MESLGWLTVPSLAKILVTDYSRLQLSLVERDFLVELTGSSFSTHCNFPPLLQVSILALHFYNHELRLEGPMVFMSLMTNFSTLVVIQR